MKHLQNENTADRIVRILLATIFGLSAAVFANGVTQSVFFIISGILAITGISGFCPLYKLFGHKTTI